MWIGSAVRCVGAAASMGACSVAAVLWLAPARAQEPIKFGCSMAMTGGLGPNKLYARAAAAGVAALGYDMAPRAYTQMQVLEPAVEAKGREDDKLARYVRKSMFKTVLGVKEAKGGEWAEPCVPQVQFQNVRGKAPFAVQGCDDPGGGLTALIDPYGKSSLAQGLAGKI